MLTNFIAFDTTGKIHHETGTKPPFLNKMIASIDLNTLTGCSKIQDRFVYYSIKLPLIFVAVSSVKNENCLESEINRISMKSKNTAAECEKVDELDFSNSRPAVNIEAENNVVRKVEKKIFSLFSRKIKKAELEEKFKTKLIEKNVESEIAQKITKGLMSRISEEWINENDFKIQMQETLGNFIKKIEHEELIGEIRKCKETNKLFSFCFVGVNGVGKSTSVAKMCYWLLKNNLKVYIAACDTFRAGAVEQLKIYASRFTSARGNQVGFYDEGYGKDDFVVCKAATKRAKDEGYDVILIDTSGRMHNNTSLMNSLSKLIKTSRPNHIIFVGEALVGGDSVDHLKSFNKYINEGTDRKIDSIILTKADTVDDKIGQIVNMCVSASAPILFIGNGQSNVDLIAVETENIANMLMS